MQMARLAVAAAYCVAVVCAATADQEWFEDREVVFWGSLVSRTGARFEASVTVPIKGKPPARFWAEFPGVS